MAILAELQAAAVGVLLGLGGRSHASCCDNIWLGIADAQNGCKCAQLRLPVRLTEKVQTLTAHSTASGFDSSAHMGLACILKEHLRIVSTKAGQ